MSNTAKLTKPRIRQKLLNCGVASDRVDRALYVYEVYLIILSFCHFFVSAVCVSNHPLNLLPVLMYHRNGDQKNYAIYDFGVVSEIVYRLEVKDKVNQFEQSQRTLCDSKSSAKEALESMDLGAVYINMALQQYEVFHDIDSMLYILCYIFCSVFYSPFDVVHSAVSDCSFPLISLYTVLTGIYALDL